MTTKCPLESGSQYYNCKGFFSNARLAICDAYDAFKLVDIGEYGSTNDIGIFSDSEMGKLFHSKKMNLPDVESLANGTTHTLPFFLVGDEAFALKALLQKPYPGKMNLPDVESLANGTTHTLPFFLVRDEAFALKALLQKPYPGDRRIDRIPSAYSKQDEEFSIFKLVLKLQCLSFRLRYVCTTIAAYFPAGFTMIVKTDQENDQRRRIEKNCVS